ncbi:hypothetical protein Rhe02_14540 [Rhizocola hellebori]|uniref:Uncharacterized protein n=1 Tax=Rhizocola hellebori TaxID=1392758 RepID=A0A8J3VEJ7_9ACTN|nr:hypothetical protein [Rhizocola hellebori]GIH03387.1 hypothetical protein Rhe02_14540 [Rhizocola hellebori]
MTTSLQVPNWYPYAQADTVYETLAAHQVGDDLRMNDDVVITVSCVQARFDAAGIEVRFASPSHDRMSRLRICSTETSNTVVDVIEGLVTAYASHWASLLENGPWCCGNTMESDHDDTADVVTRYRCVICYSWYTRETPDDHYLQGRRWM